MREYNEELRFDEGQWKRRIMYHGPERKNAKHISFVTFHPETKQECDLNYYLFSNNIEEYVYYPGEHDEDEVLYAIKEGEFKGI